MRMYIASTYVLLTVWNYTLTIVVVLLLSGKSNSQRYANVTPQVISISLYSALNVAKNAGSISKLRLVYARQAAATWDRL